MISIALNPTPFAWSPIDCSLSSAVISVPWLPSGWVVKVPTCSSYTTTSFHFGMVKPVVMSKATSWLDTFPFHCNWEFCAPAASSSKTDDAYGSTRNPAPGM